MLGVLSPYRPRVEKKESEMTPEMNNCTTVVLSFYSTFILV